MRHRVAHRKLGRITPHRTALLRNLATALFERERIRTTLAKRDADRLHARRLVLRDIRDETVVKKLFDNLGARFAARAGGYTRILRLGPRKGDGAEMAILELLGSEYKPKDKVEKTAAKDEKAKASPAGAKSSKKKEKEAAAE